MNGRNYSALILFFLIPLSLVAQGTDPEGRNSVPTSLQFGPPLRAQFVFAYKYTERVRTLLELEGTPYDSTDRTLTYFMTMHQTVSNDGSRRVMVELNVDSMQLDLRSSGDSLHFHTQHLQGDDWNMVRHREILVPSAFVSRPLMFQLSPYGEIMGISGKALADLREQGEIPEVDPFTRARLKELTTDDYMASVLLPWRCVVPLGALVEVERPVVLKSVPLTLDRVAFRNNVNSTLEFGKDGLPVLRFDATLDSVVTPTITLLQFDQPLNVVGAEGTITGKLKMQEDGVVTGGWSVATGTINADRGGQKVTERVTHEVFIESMGTVTYAGG